MTAEQAGKKRRWREEVQQMILAARLYYEEGRTQAEVASELGVSRPTVSRLLQRARENGIVRISISDPFATDEALAQDLRRATGLAEVIVLPGSTTTRRLTRRRLGLAAALFLEEALHPGDLVGVGWGRTLYAVTQALDYSPKEGLRAVPLLGGLTQIAPSFQVHEITRRIAEAFGGTWRPFYAPAIVEDPRAHASLMQSEDVQAVAREWLEMSLALVGIGNVAFVSEVEMLFAEYLDQRTKSRLREAGAVGDICMRFYDENGNPVEDGVRGVIGVELEVLRNRPRVVAVAGGEEKAEAILGAIRGGYVKTLITDEAAARGVLDLMGG